MQSNSQTEKELGEREGDRERERNYCSKYLVKGRVETGDEDATPVAAREIVA